MNKVRIRRRRKQRLRANHWQTVALMILVTIQILLNVIMLIMLLSPFPSKMLYGELNHTNTDDMKCITIGNYLMSTTAYYCCNMYRAFRTTDLTDNLTYDTTQCIKLDNIYIKK